MTLDFASSLVGAGLGLILLGVFFLFGPAWVAVVAGAILFLTGLGAHVNAGRAGAATDGDVADAA